MKKWSIGIICLLAATLCACHGGQETGRNVTPVEGTSTPSLTPEVTITTMPPEMTGMPSTTEAPGNSPMPSVTEMQTPEPEGELIPIDEEHFTSADFRKIISAKYDMDEDGCLSRTEREAVCLIHWDYFDLLQEGFILEEEAPVLDGLGYFPNLRFLTVRKAGRILLQDHPSVRGLQVEEGGAVAYVQIERCPLFQFISNPFSIKSCYIADAAPEILLEATYGNSVQYKSILYGGLNIYKPELFPGLAAEEENRIFGRKPLKEWVGKTENGRAFSKEVWEQYLLGQEINFYEVSVAEKTEEPSDMQGKKGWLAVVDHYDASDMGVEYFPFYADEIPDADSIRISIGEISKIIQLNYEADRGCILSAECSLKVVYQGKEGEELLGIIQEKLYQCVIDGDTVRITPYRCQGLEVTHDSDGERIPIDGEHFSSKVFQRYLEEKYSADVERYLEEPYHVKGLSTDAREDVMVMDFSGSIRFAREAIDGLEYFPKLTDLYLGHTGSLVVENHPSLEVIGGDAPGLKRLVVRNCPELRRIDLDLSKIEEVMIEGCGKLDELIPIDEAHFTCGAFREFLSILYDVNRDGFLSLAEREAVEEIYWDEWYALEEMGISKENIEQPWHLDGFEYFPCLKSLTVISARSVVLKNHPSIQYVGGNEGGVGQLLIEDCPALERIGASLYGGAEWSVTNCENLKYFSVHDSEFGSLAFSGCPQLVLDFREAGNRVGSLLLDADAVLTELPGGICRIVDGSFQPPFWKDGLTCETIQWENVSEQAIEMPLPAEEEDFFRYFGKDDFAYMGVQVLEKIEDIYDEQGRKGWNICIDRKENAYSKTAFSLYAEETPEPEQIFVRPVGVSEAGILEYSPNKGVSFHIIWKLEVVYTGTAGETVLGTMLTGDRYWTIAPDGTKKSYRSEKDWKENGSRRYRMYEQLRREAEQI